jgi:hypothetical protein
VEKTTFANRGPIGRSSWVALSALAVGALLGGVWVLGRWWIVEPSLLYTALQSAFSTAVLGVLASARSEDLSLDVESLPVCPDLVQACVGERSERWAEYGGRLWICGAVGAV